MFCSSLASVSVSVYDVCVLLVVLTLVLITSAVDSSPKWAVSVEWVLNSTQPVNSVSYCSLTGHLLSHVHATQHVRRQDFATAAAAPAMCNNLPSRSRRDVRYRQFTLQQNTFLSDCDASWMFLFCALKTLLLTYLVTYDYHKRREVWYCEFTATVCVLSVICRHLHLRSVFERSLHLVRQPGTLCCLSYVTRPSHLTVLGIHWKRTCISVRPRAPLWRFIVNCEGIWRFELGFLSVFLGFFT